MMHLNNKQIRFLTEAKDFLEKSFNSNDYLLFWCLKGKAEIGISERKFIIRQNVLIMCLPTININYCMMSLNFEYRCLVLSDDLIKQSNWMFNNEFTIISINQNDLESINLYYEFLMILINLDVKNNIIDNIVKNVIKQIQYAISKYQTTFVNICEKSKGDIYDDFITLVSLFYNKNRDVKFYADKLNVSPKYLSYICKRNTGESANVIIDKYTGERIKYLLVNTNKSIKEIALDLNFNNVSFFGKYTKRLLGLSPKIYRLNNKLPLKIM